MESTELETVTADPTQQQAVLDIMPLNSRQIETVNGTVVFIVSSILNVLLVIVLATERNATLRPYSNILTLNCACDLLLTCMSFITDLQVEFTNGHFAVSLKGIYVGRSIEWQYVGVGTWVSSMYLSILVIPLVFYFRYCLVVKNTQLTKRQLLKYIMLPISAAISIGSCIMVAFIKDQRRQTCEQALWHPLWTYNGASIQNCLIAEPSNPYVIVYIVALGSTNMTMYTLMIYFTYGIFKTLKATRKSMGAKTLRLQKQMNILLIIQLLMPVFCACLPLSCVLVLTFLRFTVSGLAIWTVIFLEWIPLINPLITILFVTNYRRRVARLLCWPIKVLTGRARVVSSTGESGSYGAGITGGTAPGPGGSLAAVPGSDDPQPLDARGTKSANGVGTSELCVAALAP